MSLQELNFTAIKKASCFSALIKQMKEVVPIPPYFFHPLEVLEVGPVTAVTLAGYTDACGPTRQPLLCHVQGLPLVGAVSLPSLGLLSITNPSTLELRLQFMLQGKIAALCLLRWAGGQGTRLGSNAPKGIFDIGLPSQISLSKIYCDRLWRIQAMAAFCKWLLRHSIQTLVLQGITDARHQLAASEGARRPLSTQFERPREAEDEEEAYKVEHPAARNFLALYPGTSRPVLSFTCRCPFGFSKMQSWFQGMLE